MSADFKESRTKENLMRAFAGESQARNRYTIAAAQAKKENLHVIEMVFSFTAEQEKEHAAIFYNHLSGMAGENIAIEGAYPVDLDRDIAKLLRYAQHNEYEEHDSVYSDFAATAKEEGFPNVAASFSLISDIEKLHGDRFGKFAELLESGKLFVSDVETGWMCLKCGYVYYGKEAPERCPVCQEERGYFIRMELAPYTGACCKQK